jgi:hypothetical protein
VIIRENTVLDPRVEEAAAQAARKLSRAKIPHVLTGGVFLNRCGVGRPTFDVDIVVARRHWQKAVDALLKMSVDSERMGLANEPNPAAILKTKAGPMLEIFPEDLTAGEIAELRGVYRRHPAGSISFSLRGDPVVNLINSKLASHLSATDRLQDLSDVQRLIKKMKLEDTFSLKLDRRVRKTFRDLCHGLVPATSVRYAKKGRKKSGSWLFLPSSTEQLIPKFLCKKRASDTL